MITGKIHHFLPTRKGQQACRAVANADNQRFRMEMKEKFLKHPSYLRARQQSSCVHSTDSHSVASGRVVVEHKPANEVLQVPEQQTALLQLERVPKQSASGTTVVGQTPEYEAHVSASTPTEAPVPTS